MTWICIIDDDREVGDVLAEVLRSAGYGARAFVDGSDALAAIEASAEEPRLVLLDLMLPNLSGREVLRRLRVGRHAPQVPVVIITGMEDVLEASFDPWRVSVVLHKPVAIEDLVETIARVLRKTGD